MKQPEDKDDVLSLAGDQVDAWGERLEILGLRLLEETDERRRELRASVDELRREKRRLKRRLRRASTFASTHWARSKDQLLEAVREFKRGAAQAVEEVRS